MTDLSGITITPGIMPGQLKESLAETVNQIGAKMIDTVRIDTTHFVCTEARGQAWEKAVEMNVPVVVPDWIKGCEREGKIVGVRGYYLDADPKLRQMGPSTHQQRGSVSSTAVARDSPRIEHTPPTPERNTHGDRGENGAASTEAPRPPPKTVPEDEDSAEEESQAGISEKTKEVEDSDEESDDTEKLADDPEKGAAAEDEPKSKGKERAQSPTTPGEKDGEFDEVQL